MEQRNPAPKPAPVTPGVVADLSRPIAYEKSPCTYRANRSCNDFFCGLSTIAFITPMKPPASFKPSRYAVAYCASDWCALVLISSSKPAAEASFVAKGADFVGISPIVAARVIRFPGARRFSRREIVDSASSSQRAVALRREKRPLTAMNELRGTIIDAEKPNKTPEPTPNTPGLMRNGQPGAIAFWRSLGYRDYCLTLEIVPESKRSG